MPIYKFHTVSQIITIKDCLTQEEAKKNILENSNFLESDFTKVEVI